MFCSVTFWLFPDVPGTFWIGRGGARLSEPLMLFRLARRQETLKADEGSTSSDVLEQDFGVSTAGSQGDLEPQHTATGSPLPRRVSRFKVRPGREHLDRESTY